MEKKREGFKGQRAIVLPHNIKQILKNDTLTRLLYVTDIGYYPAAGGHFRTRDNGSKQNILIYCAEGEGWYCINKQKKTVKRNQFFIVPAGLKHSYGASDKNPWCIYWIHFTGEQCRVFDSMFGELHTIEESTTARFKDRIQLFEEIYHNLEMGYSIENLQYTSLCLFHLLGSFRYIPQFREINKAKSTDIIQLSIKFMRENIQKKVTLAMLADEIGYSPSHFSFVFSQKTGFSPLDYFNYLKVQIACQYIDFSSLKMKEIAAKLGFSDQYYFSKVFTKYMQLSPTEYRAKKKGSG